VAVNPVTDKIYVGNGQCAAGSVTVIDGATNATTTVAGGGGSVAVNPVTNTIYASTGNQTVAVIDGATNTTTTVATGGGIPGGPVDVAVNPVTDKIYVVNNASVGSLSSVAVIDGATNTVIATLPANGPTGVAVNPVTNKIYALGGVNGVAVIDGATNTITATVPAGTLPSALAVNPVTNKIYVGNNSSANVTVIDGATNATTTVAAGTNPGYAVEVNPVTDKIYVGNNGSNNVTVIDGATNTTTTVAAGNGPGGVAVNPVTNNIYVANGNYGGSGTVTVITEQPVQTVQLQVGIAPLAGNATTSPTPTFTLTATTGFSPSAPPIAGVAYQVDTWQGLWLAATNTGGNTFSATTPPLQPGLHILYAYATDAQAATSTNTGGFSSSPLTGSIAAYVFSAVPTPPLFTADSPPTSATVGRAYSYTFAATGNPAPTFSVTTGTVPPGLSLNATTGVLSGTPTTCGAFTSTITAANGAPPNATTPSMTITVSPKHGRCKVK
jgi:YVTN family beta-propeller protein